MRQALIERKTKETDVRLNILLEGTGRPELNSGIDFLDHMLTLFAAHSQFDLHLVCLGDTEVDFHHSVEDIGICLGQAFKQALGDKKGIVRYASLTLPMDEALVMAAVDISGRSLLDMRLDIKAPAIGTFDTELIEEFFTAFVREAGITLHVRQLAGRNAHHIAEAVFKAVARVLRAAVRVEGSTIPSTKGVL